MARTILHTPIDRVRTAANVVSRERATSAVAVDVTLLLRKQRSAQYLAAVASLDAGTHLHDPVAYQAFQQAIQEEFSGIAIDDFPLLGIVARCNLGRPFEVHTLDLKGQIVRHYKSIELLPPQLERARSLALHSAYAFVEVYTDRLVAVSSAGDTAVIQE